MMFRHVDAQQRCCLALTVLGLVFLLVPVRAQTPAFQGLGQQFFGNFASAVSGDGSVVVGSYDVSGTGLQTHAFRWTASGGFQDLGTLGGAQSEAYDTSGDGSVVVGRAINACDYRPFRWTSVGGMQDIGGGDGCRRGDAMDVSSDGSVVVGNGAAAANGWFRWTTSGGIETFFPGVATGVSPDGQVVVGYGNSGFQAFRWTASTGYQQLGSLGDSDSFADATNGPVVVGQSRDKDMFWRAFRWTAERGMEDLGDLGGPMSAAYAISADGSVIVGKALQNTMSSSERAFRWTTRRQMEDLKQALLNAGVTAVQNWTLRAATGVSADGTVIVGFGRNPNLQWESFRAVLPLPR